MTFITRNRPAIVSGIIASFVFLYFIQPILIFLGRLLLDISELLGTAFINRIYAQVSHLETHDYSFTLLLLVFFVFLVIAWGLCLKIGITPKIEPFESRKEIEKEEIEEPKSKKISILRLSVLSVYTILALVVIVGNYVQLSIISSFNQHIRIIAPYIDDTQKELLLSKWSLMQSRDDYDEIYIEIYSIAKANGVVLPENKIYSPLTI